MQVDGSQNTMKKKSFTNSSANEALADASGAALLDAARAIFINEGVKGLSVRRVAEHAGCTTMAVYSRYKGKDGILGALYDEGFDVLAKAQLAVPTRLVNEDRVLAFCQAYRATALAYPHHYALMLGHFSGELQPSENSQAKALSTLDRLTDAVQAMATMKGEKRIASAEIANRLFAFCHGWVSLERLGFFGTKANDRRAFDHAVLGLVATDSKKSVLVKAKRV
jgi:AcrR family transcriptional regulator